MPAPSSFGFSRLTGFFPMNTLSRAFNGTSTESQDAEPPAAKRQKFDDYTPLRFGIVDEIVDHEQDKVARTEHHGSQGEWSSHSQIGITEYSTVEKMATHGSGRSNRRRRQPNPGRQSLTGKGNRPQSIDPGRDDIIDDDFDRLSLPSNRSPARPRPKLLTEPRIRKTQAGADPVDRAIKGGYPREQQKSKKRHNRPSDIEDDELAEITTASLVKKVPPASVSRKGDIGPTRWSGNLEKVDAEIEGIGLASALCFPNHRYIRNDEQPNQTLFLRPARRNDALIAYTGEGNMSEHVWLTISQKANNLFYNSQSPYIKIEQSSDSGSDIGRMMMLKCLNYKGAAYLRRLVEQHLPAVAMHELDCTKLESTYKKLLSDISTAVQCSPKASLSSPKISEKDAYRSPQRAEAHQAGRAAVGTSSVTPSTDRLRARLKDRMQVSQQGSSQNDAEPTTETLSPRRRALRGAQPDILESPEPGARLRWSDQNQDWVSDWKMPLAYKRTVVDQQDIPRLDEGECLNDNLIGFGLKYLFEEYPDRHPDLQKRVYIHNSFFYEKLRSNTKGHQINYDGVKGWTAKLDLLSYDYIIVPVNEMFHWWVAIICHPGRLDPDAPRSSVDKTDGEREAAENRVVGKKQEAQVEGTAESLDVDMTGMDDESRHTPRDSTTAGTNTSPIQISAEDSQETHDVKVVEKKHDIVDLVADEKSSGGTKRGNQSRNNSGLLSKKDNTDEPRIITLDSLGASHYPATKALRLYILAEYEDKRKKRLGESAKMPGRAPSNIPCQDNFSDCGVYLLGYIQEFVKDPDGFIRSLLQKDKLQKDNKPKWGFTGSKWGWNGSERREYWRDIIFKKHKIYQEQEMERRRSKRDTTRRITSDSPAQRTSFSQDQESKSEAEAPQPSKADRNPASPLPHGSRAASSTLDATFAQTPETATGIPQIQSQRGQAEELSKRSSPTRPEASLRNQVVSPKPQSASNEWSADEVSLVNVPTTSLSKQDSEVLESTEIPDSPVITHQVDHQEEPRFIPKLGSSPSVTSARQSVEKNVQEVKPNKFYNKSQSPHHTSQTTPVSSSRKGEQQDEGKRRMSPSLGSPRSSKRQNRTGESGRVVNGSAGMSPYFNHRGPSLAEQSQVPVIVNAQMVDLTEDE